MPWIKSPTSPFVFIATLAGLCVGGHCHAEEKPVVRCYEGNGGVTVELVVSGPPEKEWALLRIRGKDTEAEQVIHQASVRRSPVSTSFVESINGVTRTIFVVRMHQGFLMRQGQEPYVLGESARVERLGNMGLKLQRSEAEKVAAHEAGKEKEISKNLTGNRP